MALLTRHQAEEQIDQAEQRERERKVAHKVAENQARERKREVNAAVQKRIGDTLREQNREAAKAWRKQYPSEVAKSLDAEAMYSLVRVDLPDGRRAHVAYTTDDGAGRAEQEARQAGFFATLGQRAVRGRDLVANAPLIVGIGLDYAGLRELHARP